SEVRARCRAHPADRLSSTLAQVHVVQIGLEDLFLGIAPLHDRGEPGLADLPPERPPGPDQTVLDELLRDRAAALRDPAGANVRPGGSNEAVKIETSMLEEPVVLRGENGADEAQRNVGQPHRTEILAAAVGATGEDLALQPDAIDELAVPPHPDDAVAGELEADAHGSLAGVLFEASHVEVPGRGRASKMSGRGRQGRSLFVLEARQRSREVDGAHADPRRQWLTRGVHERRPSRLGPAEAVELYHRVRGNAGGREGHQRAGAPDDEREESGLLIPAPQGEHSTHAVPCEPRAKLRCHEPQYA